MNMIFDYGFSVVGKSHIARGTSCQDSHYIKKLENGWVIAAVADGVGSAKNSGIASKIAAKTVVELCAECMPWDYSLISIKSMMRTAYNYAYKLILRESQKSGEPIESYDTTLTMVIYDGQRIIYGHSGDGGIIGLTTFGDYVSITRPQKGEDGVSVIPLRAGYTHWVIDTYEEDLSAVLLMTDGMLGPICPYLLRDNDKKIDHAYVPLASFFADPGEISKSNESEIRETIGRFVTAENDYDTDEFYRRLSAILKTHLSEGVNEIIEVYKQKNYPIALMLNEQDDKTIVGLLNTDLMLDNKDAAFYSEPNWEMLQEAWNRKAYPHMYNNPQNESDEKIQDNTDATTEMLETDVSTKLLDESEAKQEVEKTEFVDESETNQKVEKTKESETDKEVTKEDIIDNSKVENKVEETVDTDDFDDIISTVEKNEATEVDAKAKATKDSTLLEELSTISINENPQVQNISLPLREVHKKNAKKGLSWKIFRHF
jgi:hypothetical protein